MFKITASEKQFILARRGILKPFKELADSMQGKTQKDFIAKFGKPVGRGKGREVYIFKLKNRNFVVKRALNELGEDQNVRQDDVYRIMGSPKILCPVYALSDDCKILIMAYAKPLKKFSQAMKNAIGIKEVFIDDYRFNHLSRMELLADEKWQELGNWDWGGEKGLANVYLDGKKNSPDTPSIGFGGDFIRPSSWGIFLNRLVLIDYGY